MDTENQLMTCKDCGGWVDGITRDPVTNAITAYYCELCDEELAPDQVQPKMCDYCGNNTERVFPVRVEVPRADQWGSSTKTLYLCSECRASEANDAAD